MVEYLSNKDGGYQLKLIVEEVSQSISGNSSQVRVRLLFSTEDFDFSAAGGSAYVDINGQRLNWSSTSYWVSKGRTSTLIDQTLTIAHNPDGVKSIPVSAYFNNSTGYVTYRTRMTISEQQVKLTTIARVSSFSVGSGVIGSPLVITIDRPHNTLTHTLRYSWGTKSGTIATNVATSYRWTIPNDFATLIPSATSGTGTLYLDTFSGNTKTGTQQITFSATVPNNMKPSFSGLTLADSNRTARSLLSGNNFIQILSDIQVTFNGATGSYGSTITGYRAEIVNRNQVTTTNGGSLGIMKFNGSATIRASVYDSRGRQSDTRDVTINVIEYFPPNLSFSATRTKANANHIQVVRNAQIAPISLSGMQKNTMTLSFKVSPFGSSSFTTDNGSASGTYNTQSNLVNHAANLSGTYAANKSYTVIGTLSDKFTSVEFSVNVSPESVVMSYDKEGRVGIGKPAELGKAGSLDVAGDMYAGGKLIQQHQLTSGNPVLGYGKMSVDANTTYDTGFYWTSVNVPGGDWGVLESYRFSEKEVQQIFRQRNGSRSWSRYRNHQTGVWTAWVVVGIDQFYPIGAVYASTANTSPVTVMGGTWQQLTTQTLFGATIYAWKRTA